MKFPPYILFGAALIGAVLFFIRHLSANFYLGTTTVDHPYILFTACLIFSGVVWTFLIPAFRNWTNNNSDQSHTAWPTLGLIIALGLAFRAIFFGSIPIYEDDWNRYLWDGVVITQGESPYKYSPTEILQNHNPEHTQNLKEISDSHNQFLRKINNQQLTTIYPPVAQAVFALAAFIKPLNLDALRLLFLLSEAITMFMMIKALSLYDRSPLWLGLYALNPLLIFSAFNAAHMDILLAPALIGTVIAMRRHPLVAALMLSIAAAIKIWPLLLAPIIFRPWRTDLKTYISCALIVAGLSLLMLWPMLATLSENSGLAAYSTQWQRSSFLFPLLEKGLSLITKSPGDLARIIVAIILISISLWRGLISPIGEMSKRPAELMLVTLALYILSPTGFPWYLIWVLIFVPFKPIYGLAALCALTPLYYVRFGLGELGQYSIYTNWLIPLQFGLPIIILLFEFFKRGRHA